LASGLLLAGGASADPTLADREAQAEAVLAQVRAIDSELAMAAEAYNLANIKLDKIRSEQKANGVRLTVARKSLGVAQRILEERLVALYTSADPNSTLEVLLGATSLEDLMNGLDTAERVSGQDAEVLRQVKSYRNQVKAHKAQLARARAAQEQIVAERSAHQRAVGQRLRERQALLATIKDEIRRIQARERARQLALTREAQARIARYSPDAAAASAAQAALGADVPARYTGVVGIAMRYLGIPYRWGGSSPSGGFDCSGFVMYVYAQVGVSLPHNAAMQYGYGTPVSKENLQPGDLVFFDGLGHNGLYIGGGQFIHAPHTGDVVKISNLNEGWYLARFVGARRL
jgi:cell wall-associated NlpC family hydrolase